MGPFAGAPNGRPRAAVLQYDQQMVVLHQDQTWLFSQCIGDDLLRGGGGGSGCLLFESQNFR